MRQFWGKTDVWADFIFLASAEKQISASGVFCELFRLACVFVVLGRFSLNPPSLVIYLSPVINIAKLHAISALKKCVYFDLLVGFIRLISLLSRELQVCQLNPRKQSMHFRHVLCSATRREKFNENYIFDKLQNVRSLTSLKIAWSLFRISCPALRK